MDLLLDRVLDGLNNGVIYALLALALVSVYRGTGHLNIAQGEMAMFSAFIAYAFLAVGLPLGMAISLAVAAAAVAGGCIERLVVRPLEKRGEFPLLLAMIAIFLMLNAGAGVIWGGEPLAFPAVVPSGPDDFVSVLGTRLRYQNLAVFVLLAAVLGILFWIFYRTRLGLAMRVAASNPESAVLLGIPVHRINSLGWMLAGAIGALAGIFVAPSTTLTPGMMLNFFIYACVAATVGGFDSPGGAVLAGLVIGVVENLMASYVDLVGPDLKQSVALLFLVVVLMVRPTGLFGSTRVARV